MPKDEEWVEHSTAKIRADRVHEKLLALGYVGSERTTRGWPSREMWLQYDFGDGPVIDG